MITRGVTIREGAPQYTGRWCIWMGARRSSHHHNLQRVRNKYEVYKLVCSDAVQAKGTRRIYI